MGGLKKLAAPAAGIVATAYGGPAAGAIASNVVGGLTGGGESSGGGFGTALSAGAATAGAALAARERKKEAERVVGRLREAQDAIAKQYGNDAVFGANLKEVYDSLGGMTDFFTPLTVSDPGLKSLFAQTIAANLANLPEAQKLTTGINDGLRAEAIKRQKEFNPYFLPTLRQQGRNALLASQGVLPRQDVEEIGRTTAESRGSRGGARGLLDRLTARDLGIAQFDLQSRTAPSLLQQTLQSIELADPINRYALPQSYLADPQFVAGQAIGENLNDAKFANNERDFAFGVLASPDPEAVGLYEREATLQQMLATLGGIGTPLGAAGSTLQSLGLSGLQGSGAFDPLAGSLGNLFGGGGSGSSNGLGSALQTALSFFGGGSGGIPKAQALPALALS